MVEMGGIEPPSNKPLLSRSFRKPKFAHNNVKDFNTLKDLTSANAYSEISAPFICVTLCLIRIRCLISFWRLLFETLKNFVNQDESMASYIHQFLHFVPVLIGVAVFIGVGMLFIWMGKVEQLTRLAK